MINDSQPTRRTPIRTSLAAAAFAVLAGGALLGPGSGPAAAQSTNWQDSCSMRVVTPGPGDILRNYNCARQKECQELANARGAMVMENGCFFVTPSASAPAPQAGRSRPAQQQ